MPDTGRLPTARVALAVALVVARLNFLLTVKWAPQYIEMLRYPDYFPRNNLLYAG